MTTEQLLYKLTGTETPKFITARETQMIMKFQKILKEEQELLLEALKDLDNRCRMNDAEYNMPHVTAAIKSAEQ